MKKVTYGIIAATLALSMNAFSQTNVFDDIIATSPNHNYLEAALTQENLAGALQSNTATLTVFAPTDQAFDNLAAALNTDINGLLALPNLTDILTYHVLGTTVPSSGVTNGAIVQPLSMTNTLKLTVTGSGDVFANQAEVTAFDLSADNGVVHVLDAIVLPNETVVDVAIDNNFTSLTTAVVTAELLPALTDPLATLTVFAPTDQAFNEIAAALNTNIAGLLALPNLADILTYHVLGTTVMSSGVTNGAIVQPLSMTNTLKLTVTGAGDVFVNQAKASAFDITAENGVVHVLDAVVLPAETVVDVAIDNGFNSLTTAVVTAELLPALTNPLAGYTVFAPTDQAFDDLATALSTDIAGLLANPELADILLYHVIDDVVLSGDLMNGTVPTLNGQSVTVDLSSGVQINTSNVTMADVLADNGVVHVVDAVLVPSLADLEEEEAFIDLKIFPNPSSAQLTVEFQKEFKGEFQISDVNGKLMKQERINNQMAIETDISTLPTGDYYITVNGNSQIKTFKFSKI